ncbi:MAG: diacylglycerol kinase family protein [Wenzhouxiangella sp.]|jgi:hypothetical protein|nr:diacylglycerol kinase family protein [Wenzhouxiangella sp.]
MSSLAAEPDATGTTTDRQATIGPAAACILVNPRSFRLSEGDRLDQVCRTAQAAGTSVNVVHDPDEIRSALADFGSELPGRLILIGGDGTVQAAASALIEAPLPKLPDLLVLGGGRTNFTARDLGTHRSLVALMEQALHRPQALATAHRRILRLEQPGTGRTLHGFFVAGALVDHVIRDCHSYRKRHRGWLRTGHPSSAWRVLQLGLLGAMGRSRFRPRAMTIDAGALGTLDQPARILIATSLQHQRGWIDPYAVRGSGPVRLTAIGTRAARFWPTLPGLLRGRLAPALTPETGYLSGRTDRVSVRGLDAVCVDGQEYDLDPGLEVTLRPGPEFHFLTP